MNTVPAKEFQPAFDMILVRGIQIKEKTQGGIILPDEMRKKNDEGIIVRVGPDVKYFKPKQHIIFGKYGGVEMEFNKEKFILMHETDILGVMQ